MRVLMTVSVWILWYIPIGVIMLFFGGPQLLVTLGVIFGVMLAGACLQLWLDKRAARRRRKSANGTGDARHVA